jgi:hypothetical protein
MRKGFFANRAIRTFVPYIKRNNTLDVERLKSEQGLNDKQIPLLEAELIEFKYMKALEPELETLKKDELIAEAEKRGVEVDAKATKAEIIEAIESK